MKHFVYLDTDILNSYLSQINDGLLKNTVNEVCDEVVTKKEENSKPGEEKFKTEIGIPSLFKMTFSDDKDVLNTTNTLSQIESGRELIEKIIHDNAFEQLRNHLDKKFGVKNIKECELGEYIETTTKYIIRDLDYIYNIYTEEFIDFMCDTEFEDLKKNKPSGANKTAQKCFDKKIEDAKKEFKLQQEKTRRIFSIARNMMPFSKLLLCGDAIIPLNDKFLRESTDRIRFTYSEKIKILGKYTSTLEDAVRREEGIQNSFDSLYSSLDETFKELYINVLGLDKSAKIIQPIALYFE